MGIRSLKTASISTGVKRSKVWDQSVALENNSFESIATVNLSSNQSTITFSSIPSTYKHLQIRLIARTTRGVLVDPMNLTFNNDSSAVYSFHDFYGDGSAAYGEAGTSSNGVKMYRASASTAGAGIFGTTIVDILDYQNTSKNKTVRYLGGVDLNGSGEMFFGSGAWLNTSAINRLDITSFTSNSFVQYSSFALYGIKG
jgi:hypothetical protein